MNVTASTSALLLRTGERACAINLPLVLEIMRPLPVQKVANTPDFVWGLAIIRGVPTPVISLSSLFAEPGGTPARFVIVRAGERRVALAVDAVPGVIVLDPATLQALPPLAQNADAATLQEIGALDAQLLFVLNTTSLVPDDVWRKLARTSHE